MGLSTGSNVPFQQSDTNNSYIQISFSEMFGTANMHPANSISSWEYSFLHQSTHSIEYIQCYTANATMLLLQMHALKRS